VFSNPFILSTFAIFKGLFPLGKLKTISKDLSEILTSKKHLLKTINNLSSDSDTAILTPSLSNLDNNLTLENNLIKREHGSETINE
jgi:hypothetical protein